MTLWIKNATTIDQQGNLNLTELVIKEDKIAAIGDDVASLIKGKTEPENIIDAKGALLIPGLIDVHVHLREPGFSYKETIKTGTEAAARGGFTTICAMPNVNPEPDTPEKMLALQEKNKADAVIKVLQYAPITKGLRSDHLTDQKALIAAGAFAFTNDGVGVQSAGTMYLAMKEAAKNNVAIVAHTEDDSLLFGGVMHEGKRSRELGLPGILNITEASQIARDVLISEATGAHYHVCHVSTKESVRVIRDAKKAGIHVTAEVAPHHLILTEEDIPGDTSLYKMNPPLRSKEDRAALIKGLLDGTIDMIATDHAPHSKEEKEGSMIGSPFGIVGSETAFSLLYTHLVETGIFTLKQVVDWLTVQPAKIFNLDSGILAVGKQADLALFDLTTAKDIREEDFLSLSANTPFIGWKVKGTTVMTIADGKIVYEEVI
ncbi:MAG: dihydroorotase [Carnobacterium sp.]|uniref:dihydroorotase n=1 Tax=Carnobacterium sp. TaxID=48221 RepID=UPI002FC9D3B4